MLTQLQEAWLHDLETTTAEQCTGYLHEGDSFCCLGRACVVAIEHGIGIGVEVNVKNDVTSYDNESQILPNSVREALRLRSNIGYAVDVVNFATLSKLNDKGSTFKEIAAIIRANPEQYFNNA